MSDPTQKQAAVPPNAPDVQAALGAGFASAQPTRIGAAATDAPVYVLPHGHTLTVLDPQKTERWLPKPLRKRGAFQMDDADSFIRYFNEHKNGDSRIFANLSDDCGGFYGVLDFHGANPSWHEHHCKHILKQTLEWQALLDYNKVRMAQTDFATWLENHEEMIATPSGAELKELISTLEAHGHTTCKSAIRLQNRTIKLTFDEELSLRAGHDVGVELPAEITFGVAPFEGAPSYSVNAKLRYSLADRNLVFWYEAKQLHLVVRNVQADLVSRIADQTHCEPYRGSYAS